MDADFERLRRWRNGDEAAGKALFECLFQDLFSFFRNKCHDPEDLVQRTLLDCLEAAERFQQRSTFRVFVFSIAKNRLYSYWRKRGGRPDDTDIGSMSLEALDPTPSQWALERRVNRQVAAALRTLSLEDQVLVEGYYWQNLTAVQLGQILGVSEPAIRSRLRRALARTRAAVERASHLEDVQSSRASLDAWAEQLRATQH